MVTDTVGSVGELLRHAREQRGITLEKLASETKIPRRHLEALEHDNLAAMPGEFYRRAQIRTYARAVGLDQKLVMAQFESAVKPVEVREPPRPIPVPREPIGWRTPVLMTVCVVIAVALLGRAIAERPATPAQLSEVRPVTDAVPQPAAAVPPPASPAAVASPDTAAPPREQPAPAARPAPRPEVAIPAPIAATNPVATEAAIPEVQAVTPAEPAPTIEIPPPATPANLAAALVVTTEPAGARVTVNGIGWGVSPVAIPYLPPGDKRIRVSKEGYATQERVLRVAEGRQQSLAIQLDTAP